MNPIRVAENFDEYNTLVEVARDRRDVPQWQDGVHITEDGRRLEISKMDTSHLLATHFCFRHQFDTTPILNELKNRKCDKCNTANFRISSNNNPYCSSLCWLEDLR